MNITPMSKVTRVSGYRQANLVSALMTTKLDDCELASFKRRADNFENHCVYKIENDAGTIYALVSDSWMSIGVSYTEEHW